VGPASVVPRVRGECAGNRKRADGIAPKSAAAVITPSPIQSSATWLLDKGRGRSGTTAIGLHSRLGKLIGAPPARDTVAAMPESPEPRHGERAVSWRAIYDELEPDLDNEPEFAELAAEMYRLRGLVMAQGAETEAALGQVLSVLDPSTNAPTRTAGQLLNVLRQRLPPDFRSQWDSALDGIERAIKSRNRVVHADVRIGSSWVPYATGGGEYVPVIGLMGGDGLLGGRSSWRVLLQQEATVLAVRLLLDAQRLLAPP
jgi:hypothetical protein